jgi:hypothetical protein
VPAALDRQLRTVRPILGIQHPLEIYDTLLTLPRPDGVA